MASRGRRGSLIDIAGLNGDATGVAVLRTRYFGSKWHDPSDRIAIAPEIVDFVNDPAQLRVDSVGSPRLRCCLRPTRCFGNPDGVLDPGNKPSNYNHLWLQYTCWYKY